MSDIAAPIPIDSKVPLALVIEKQLPATPEGQIPEPDRIYGYGFGHESGNQELTFYYIFAHLSASLFH